MCPRTSALWHGRAESRGAAQTVRPGRRGAAEQELGWSRYRSACVSPWKAGGNTRGFPTPRHAPLREQERGRTLCSDVTEAIPWLRPFFDPERLGHACGTMQCAVSSHLFPVICAVQQIILINRRGLERDHHFAGRWCTDVGLTTALRTSAGLPNASIWMAVMAALSTAVALSAHARNVSPNMGRPLFDDARVASSWITSQCSTSIPFSMCRISAAIQFTGRPNPENRPCTITKSPSATIVPGSYFSVGGRLLTRLNRPSRPGSI